MLPAGQRHADLALSELLREARRGKRTLVMGVLNVTPDSFSDGGRFLSLASALEHAGCMIDEGADILDIGGESTRPATFNSHIPLDPEEEIRRIVPVIEKISARWPAIPISIDTYKARVALCAIEAGASLINDISALRADPEMAAVASDQRVPICLMHMLGLPMSIPLAPAYGDVVAEVHSFLKKQADYALKTGIAPENVIVDPGIGFGKRPVHNLELLRRLREISALGFPLLVGFSRKSTIGLVLGNLPPEDRLEGTAATVAISIANGASVVRVHDVRAMARVARMTDAIVHGWP